MSEKSPRQQSFFFIWMIVFGLYLWYLPKQIQRAEEQAAEQAAEPAPAEASEPGVANSITRDETKLPPVVLDDLLLDDPAWAELRPVDQPAQVLRRLEGTKQPEQVARLRLTAAYLFEATGSLPEAAKLYSQLSGQTEQRRPAAGDPQAARAMTRAAHAHLRAAELYLQAGADAPDDAKRFGKQARKALDTLVMQIQRDAHGFTTILERGDDGTWRESADPYGLVLERIDQITREQLVYRLIDGLVKLCGNRAGLSQILALVLLAVGLKLAMYPLSKKQYQSMAAMQRVAPELEQVRKRYKDNPQRLNEEMMKLYREQGVNPVGGCLPMLVQFPVFIAVYQGIRAYTYHFHHASFLWIDSLAGPDTPLLLVYGVSMFATQYLMMRRQPPPADPQQAMMQKYMTWGMPVIFTWMMYSWRLPSAFYLYWMTFNVISTVEQTVAYRKKAAAGPPATPREAVVARAVEPPSGKPEPAGRKRAGRKSGGRRKRRGG